MTNKTRKWVRGGVEILIHGGTSALIAGIVMLLQNNGWSFFSHTFWAAVGFQFVGNGLVRFLQWWNNNPLPPEEDSTPPFNVPTPVISINPLSKVLPVTPETKGTP